MGKVPGRGGRIDPERIGMLAEVAESAEYAEAMAIVADLGRLQDRVAGYLADHDGCGCPVCRKEAGDPANCARFRDHLRGLHWNLRVAADIVGGDTPMSQRLADMLTRDG